MSLDLLKGIDVRYSEEEIKILCRELNWKGTGIETDPIIINNVKGLAQKFAFIKSRLFINISSCTIDEIALKDCQNVSISDCSFGVLILIYSVRNKVVNSNISRLSLNLSYYNQFIDCRIAKALRHGSDDNFFENCSFTKKAQKAIEKDFLDTSDLMKVMEFGILILGIMVVFYTSFYVFNDLQIGINVILSMLIYISFIILFLILRKLQKVDITDLSKKNKGV